MGQQQKSIAAPDQAKENNYLDRLHPSLKANFVPLPEANNMLTDKQLGEIFGGDWKALRDVVRLARQAVSENTDK